MRLSHLSEGVDEAAARKMFAYQPFTLPSGARTGAGLAFLSGDPLRSAHPNEVDPEKWAAFSKANDRQLWLYEDIIAGTKEAMGSLHGLTYADVACNAGYFCYRFLQEGALTATGIDASDFEVAFKIGNQNFGTSARFLPIKYDWRSHAFSADVGEFDIVTNIAFMCHCSDPTFMLETLAKMTRRCLVIYSNITRDDEFIIKFSNKTSLYFGMKFPLCFDASTMISDSLLVFGLRELGFNNIQELVARQYWPYPPKSWRCFIATRR